jgi:hypothetical protein
MVRAGLGLKSRVGCKWEVMSRARGSADEVHVSGNRRRAIEDMKYFLVDWWGGVCTVMLRGCAAIIMRRCYLVIRVIDVTMIRAST